jgi:hypothetical protein
VGARVPVGGQAVTDLEQGRQLLPTQSPPHRPLYEFQRSHSAYHEHLRIQSAPGQTNAVNNARESSKCQLKSSLSASRNIYALFFHKDQRFQTGLIVASIDNRTKLTYCEQHALLAL